jgi:hypothetical protein
MLPLISLPRFFASHRELTVPMLCPITKILEKPCSPLSVAMTLLTSSACSFDER